MRELETKNLLTLKKVEQSSLAEVSRMGGSDWIVTPTEALLKVADQKLSTPKKLVVRVFNVTITSIVRDTGYAPSALSSLSKTEEYRLVMGTLRSTPTKFAKDQNPAAPTEDGRFRALVTVDPFGKTFRFVTVDIAKDGGDTWLTHNVE